MDELATTERDVAEAGELVATRLGGEVGFVGAAPTWDGNVRYEDGALALFGPWSRMAAIQAAATATLRSDSIGTTGFFASTIDGGDPLRVRPGVVGTMDAVDLTVDLGEWHRQLEASLHRGVLAISMSDGGLFPGGRYGCAEAKVCLSGSQAVAAIERVGVVPATDGTRLHVQLSRDALDALDALGSDGAVIIDIGAQVQLWGEPHGERIEIGTLLTAREAELLAEALQAG